MDFIYDPLRAASSLFSEVPWAFRALGVLFGNWPWALQENNVNVSVSREKWPSVRQQSDSNCSGLLLTSVNQNICLISLSVCNLLTENASTTTADYSEEWRSLNIWDSAGSSILKKERKKDQQYRCNSQLGHRERVTDCGVTSFFPSHWHADTLLWLAEWFCTDFFLFFFFSFSTGFIGQILSTLKTLKCLDTQLKWKSKHTLWHTHTHTHLQTSVVFWHPGNSNLDHSVVSYVSVLLLSPAGGSVVFG